MVYKLKDITIRPVTIDDLNEVAKMWNFEKGEISLDAAIKAINWMIEKHRQNTLNKFEYACFGIFDNLNNSIIGWCGLDGSHSEYNLDNRIHIFYLIDKDYRNRGYATESATIMLDYGFKKMKLNRIEGGCAIDNVASKKILEKLGMIKEDDSNEEGWHFYITSNDYFKS